MSKAICGLIIAVWSFGLHAASSAFANRAPTALLHVPDQVYNTVAGQSLTLDLTRPNDQHLRPVLLFFHGGGWAYNSKNHALPWLLPWIEQGFAVVNVDYRTVDIATAPAAVEDARCALNWLAMNAERFQLDIRRIVTSGHSAGGHLALMTAYATDSGYFDRQCWNGAGPTVGAVINWYGISAVDDLMGAHPRAYAIQWIGNAADPLALAIRVSPLHYVSRTSAPTLSIHGDADTVVPFSQSLELHERLRQSGVDQRLLVIAGGQHGDFKAADLDRSYAAIWAFLGKHKLMP